MTVRLMSNRMSGMRAPVDGHIQKPSSETLKPFKIHTLAADALKIRSKIRDLCYNCTGSRLFIACRDSISVVDTHTLTLHSVLGVRCVKILRHPSDANVFAVLVMEGSEKPRPCIKVYTLSNFSGVNPQLQCTIWSAFDDGWYSASWSLDGTTIAVIDRGDRLQRIDVKTLRDTQLKQDDAILLSGEVYGLIYTRDALVVQKVDGRIEIFSLDFSKSVLEQAHSHIVLATDYNDERDLLATGGSDHIIHVFSCGDDYTCIGTYPGLEGKVSSLSFSFDGMFLAWGTKDTMFGTAESPDASAEGSSEEEYFLTVGGTNPCEIYTQHLMPTAVTHVEFAPDSYTLAYACDLDTMPKNSGSSGFIGLIRL